MADISAISFQPESAAYDGIFGTEREQHFVATPTQPSNCLDDEIEPLLRVQEHLQDSEAGIKALKVSELNTDAQTKQESYEETYAEDYEHLKTLSTEQQAEDYEHVDAAKKFSSALQYGDSNVEFSSRNHGHSDYDEPQAPNFGRSLNDADYGSSLCSDPPYEIGCGAASIEVFNTSPRLESVIPGLSSNLGLSNDEPALGSATDSVQSPEFQPYEYIKDDTTSERADYGPAVPRVLPPSFSSHDYDEGRFPTFNGMHNGYYSDSIFPGAMNQSGKTPELNTWQQAALAQAYADATKAATFRTLIEASMYPQSPDLYDKLGRSLTGASNLEHHPVYGVYRSMQSSESPPSVFNTPNLSGVLNSPTFQPPARAASASTSRSRSSGSKKSAPEFETKLLPRPSFASSDASGGSFMMVNLRMKKGAQKKKTVSGVSKRSSSGSRPRPLHEQTDSWRIGSLES